MPTNLAAITMSPRHIGERDKKRKQKSLKMRSSRMLNTLWRRRRRLCRFFSGGRISGSRATGPAAQRIEPEREKFIVTFNSLNVNRYTGARSIIA